MLEDCVRKNLPKVKYNRLIMGKYRKEQAKLYRELINEMNDRLKRGESILIEEDSFMYAFLDGSSIKVASSFSMVTARTSSNTVKNGLALANIDYSEELQKLGTTKQFNDILKENIGLIRGATGDIALRLQETLQKSYAEGASLKKIQEDLKSLFHYSDNRAKLIAYDQTRKATMAFTVTGYNLAGVKYFKWIHSGGGSKPRKLHKKYNGKIFEYDNPPIIDENTGERGYPAQAINCGCQMVPVFAEDPRTKQWATNNSSQGGVR